MIPDVETIKKLHQKYAEFAPQPGLFERVWEHCQVVGEIALACAKKLNEPVDVELLRAAALLHDVGSYPFFDRNGQASGKSFYAIHGILGAKIVLDEGFDPRLAQMIETHVLMGLTKEEIVHPTGRHWPLPARDYVPQTIEAELLCYADRFHSKVPQFNSFETLRAKLQETLPEQAAKFEAAKQRFGLPDLETLAQKYPAPIR